VVAKRTGQLRINDDNERGARTWNILAGAGGAGIGRRCVVAITQAEVVKNRRTTGDDLIKEIRELRREINNNSRRLDNSLSRLGWNVGFIALCWLLTLIGAVISILL
jgi:hypothetical protein